MIIDTSVLVAILFQEPEADDFGHRLLGADVCRISVVSRLELAIVLSQRGTPDATRRADELLRAAGIVEEPVTLEQGYLARNAYLDYGRGRHAARLNFGDCFVYALAKSLGEPLLFKGTDFGATDVRTAT